MHSFSFQTRNNCSGLANRDLQSHSKSLPSVSFVLISSVFILSCFTDSQWIIFIQTDCHKVASDHFKTAKSDSCPNTYHLCQTTYIRHRILLDLKCLCRISGNFNLNFEEVTTTLSISRIPWTVVESQCKRWYWWLVVGYCYIVQSSVVQYNVF